MTAKKTPDEKPPEAGHNSAGSADQLSSIAQRIARLEDEKQTLSEDIKEVYAEAKSNGYDVKILRKVIARQKRERADVRAEDELIALYEAQLGVFG